ncbi:hypothetical protein DFQ30_002656 [Apophysomyces sp. BC1015]|nr:hypothetical protein DFQ30_002656 [Apophysomyces sp. BC1015]KAG0179330.1 hypothetical protein DFQ29_002245 [Apophysomyces sp. BC1021]
MLPTKDNPGWAEEARSLHSLVCEAKNSASTSVAEFLQRQLQLHKSKFLRLLDNYPKQAEHRSSLQSGKAYIDGMIHKINDEFTKKALFISDQLDINEYDAATLLMHGMTDSSRVGGSPIDSAIILYHTERGYLLACIDVILKSSKDASVNEDIQSVFRGFAAELFTQIMPLEGSSDAPTGTFPAKVMRSIKSINSTIEKLTKTGSLGPTQPPATSTSTAASGSFGNTLAHGPADTGSLILEKEITALRIEWLADERIYLLQILYHMASLFLFESSDVVTLVEMLEQISLSDQATPYLLVGLLAAVSPVHHNEAARKRAGDENFLKTFHEHVTKRSWTAPVLRSVVVLQWIFFLVSVNEQDRTVETKIMVDEEQREKLIESAISEKAFEFMNEYLLYFQQTDENAITKATTSKDSIDEEWYMMVDGLTIDPSDYTKIKVNVRIEFQTFIVQELELLTLDFIYKMTNVLRNLKYREEDANLLAGPSVNVFIQTEENASERCNDLETFFMLLASIYRNRLNAGYMFWSRDESGLFNFIKWATDIKVTTTTRAFYEFIGCISTGDLCALCAHKYLEHGTNIHDLESSSLLSWGKLFAALQFYIPMLRRGADGSAAVLPQQEESLIEKLLYILKQVAQYSGEARLALWNERSLRVGDSIVEMLSCPTSPRLRMALYDIFTAFCSAWGGGVNGVGSTISLRIWHILENSDYFTTDRKLVEDNSGESEKRALQYIHQGPPRFVKTLEMERKQQHYPETLAVLGLLASLIHTQSKREELISGFEPVMSISFPWDLGKDTGSPGFGPYLSFVVDHVFLNLNSQSYLYSDHKWTLAARCLNILENSISSFDIRPIQDIDALSINPTVVKYTDLFQGIYNGDNEISQRSVTKEILLMYITHPGFNIISRILSGTDLTKEIFEIVAKAADPVAIKEKNPHFVQCVVRSLRILYKILMLQDAFGNLLIPHIAKVASRLPSGDITLSGYTFPPLPSLAPLGQLMLYHTNVIHRLPRLIEYEDEEEICYLSTKILHMLSLEPKDSSDTRITHAGLRNTVGGLGTKLAEIIGESEQTLSIIFRFSQRIEIDQPEATTYDDYEYDINNIPFWRSTATLDNRYDLESDYQPRMGSSVRLAIMDMLLDNTATGKPSPSVADLLLGKSALLPCEDSKAPNRDSSAIKLMCLHAILDTLQSDIEDNDNYTASMLTATHPIFVEKCYQLIYQLCAREELSMPILRYLRIRDDFFYTQLSALPPRIESQTQVEKSLFAGTMVYQDGTHTPTDFFVLRAQLQQRAWLLQAIALELHVAQKADAIRLLGLLYGYEREVPGDNDSKESDEAIENCNIFHIKPRAFEQPLSKMLDLLNSFEFKWVDQLEEAPEKLELDSFKGFDSKTYEVRNERGCAVFDIRAIYAFLRREQRTREETTRDMTEQNRLSMENEMGRILQKLMAENHEREIIYAKTHCLQAWKQVVQVTLSSCFDLFPIETRETMIYDLISTLLPRMQDTKEIDVNVLEGFCEILLTLLTRLKEDSYRRKFLQTDTTAEISRLPNEKLRSIFIGIFDCIQATGTSDAMRGNLYTALVGFMQYIDQHGDHDIAKHIAQKLHQRLAADSKLLGVICNDATDGLDTWRSTAYIALDGLLVLSNKVNSRAMRSFLQSNNFLRYSVDMIRRDDSVLLNILKQRDASLTPLYIYEAQMVLFIRLAMTITGADMLIESRILDAFNHCQFMHLHTQSNMIHQDNDLTGRCDRLVKSALELVVTLCSSVGRTNGTAMKKESGGFDQLHSAMMQLTAKFLSAEVCSSKVMPITDKEKTWANQSVSSAVKTSTVMSMKAEQLILCVQKNLVAYAKNATLAVDEQGRLLKPAFTHRFASITDHSLMRSSKQHYTLIGLCNDLAYFTASSKTPSLTTLVACLQNATKNLQSAVAEHKLLQTQQRNIASLKYEEIREVANTAIPANLGIQYDHLNPTQQQQVLTREIEARRKIQWKQLQNQLFVVENVLLVLWRHLEYYMRPASASRPFMQSPCDPAADETIMSSQATMFQPSVVVSQNLKNSCTTVLEPVLEKLLLVDLTDISDESVAFIPDVCGRIKGLFH